MFRPFITILAIFVLAVCVEDSSDWCYQNFYQNITSHKVQPDVKTPSGIKVDTGGYAIDLVALDARIANIEACIQDVAVEALMISAEEKQGWQCLREIDPAEELRRGCLVIKVVAPMFSKCSDWQFIGVKVPDELCLEKGLKPKSECPCMWRTAIQDENIIVTPPAMYLWEVGRIMTSCNNIWSSPFAKCLNF